jgi:hypothetical protein
MELIENPIRSLTIAMIEQAVEDYVTLRELGCVLGTEVVKEKWRYQVGLDWRYSPLGYRAPRQVAELIEFLMGPYFEKFCDHLSTDDVHWQAWKFRQRLGLVPGASTLLTRDNLYWILTPSHMRERQRNARSGTDLPPPPDSIPLKITATHYPKSEGEISCGVVVIDSVVADDFGCTREFEAA